MVFVRNDKIFAKVWKIDKKEKYADLRISTSEKVEKDGKDGEGRRLGDGAPRAKLGREADGAGVDRGVYASAQDGRRGSGDGVPRSGRRVRR